MGLPMHFPKLQDLQGPQEVAFACAANRDGSHEPVLCFLTGQVKIGTAKELRSESIVSFQTQYVSHV